MRSMVPLTSQAAESHSCFPLDLQKGCGMWACQSSQSQDKGRFTLRLSLGQLAWAEVPASAVSGKHLACPVFAVCYWEMGSSPFLHVTQALLVH